jgi:phage N-6-adenine-methyltransferase
MGGITEPVEVQTTEFLTPDLAQQALLAYRDSAAADAVRRRRGIALAPRSKWQTNQRIGTPWALFNPLNTIFKFAVDLAADADNTKCPLYITPEMDSLSENVNWAGLSEGWLWLNPPFNNIPDWVAKCKREAKKGAKIVMLTPASVGANWFLNDVFGNAVVVFLKGRLIFDYVLDAGPKKGQWNTDAYPKDCMLSIFGAPTPQITWADWRKDLTPIVDALR